MPHRPWSFSSLTLYEGCPQKYFLKYIERQPEPAKSADDPTVRGNRVHEGIEHYLKGDGNLPEEAKSLALEYSTLKTDYGKLTIEEEWGFDQNWKPLPSWDHQDISCKMKLDVFAQNTNACLIGDHKTGKDYPLKRMQQGQLYAIGAQALHPELEYFTTSFWYVDQGITQTTTYKYTQVEKFRESYQKRLHKFWSDETFAPISNKFNCKWCAYGSNGTSVCEYRSEE
jgi:hypothetical protein